MQWIYSGVRRHVLKLSIFWIGAADILRRVQERNISAMKALTWNRTAFFCVALLNLTTTWSALAEPVVPHANEEIIRDQLIIIVDETGSIGSSQTYLYEKSLVQAFTEAMPDGTYTSGIDSFAGVSSKLWLRQPLVTFDRGYMMRGADRLEPLGSLTPLARAIRTQASELEGIGGRGALLIFSDGKVRIPEDVLQACREMKEVHGGELCIFTVQIGNSERGRVLLKEMAEVNGCGRYYDGETLNTEVLVRDIFFGPRAETAPEPPMQPVAKTVDWTINNIEFDNDSSVIASSYDTLLNEAVTILKENPTVQILLEGHTDHNATNEYNQKLSERRVNAVKGALVTRSADPNRLPTGAFGEVRPTVPNDSPEHLHRNRRVELTVIK